MPRISELTADSSATGTEQVAVNDSGTTKRLTTQEIANTFTLTDRTANTFLAGPTTGADADPAFRAIVTADLPDAGVTNAKLDNMEAYTLKLRNAGTTGAPSNTGISSLTAKTTLVGDDIFLIQDSEASNAFKKVERGDIMGTVWFRDGTGLASVHNLLSESGVADSSGTIDVDSLYPGTVPTHAQALILTIEVGYSSVPAGGDGAVSLRVMPAGYNLSNVLDRAKVQQLIANTTAIDVHAMHVLMPIHPSRRTFFWARQSTDSATTNKMSIIDLWGYTI